MEHLKVAKIIKHISIDIERRANLLLKEKDISISQGILLVCLSHSPEGICPIKELEKALSTAQSTTFGVISRLESKGFVTCHLEDGRSKMVTITPSGRDVIPFVAAAIQQAEQAMFATFTPGETLLFLELLQKAEANTL